MPNSKDLFQDLRRRLTLPATPDERESMLYLLLEHQFGLTRLDILAGKSVPAYDEPYLQNLIARINREEPVQYIIGEADFFGRRFLVDSSVLIPRPETEQLVEEIVRIAHLGSVNSLLDVGTGSGCIAITAALEIPGLRVTALDISDEALRVASANARRMKAAVTFLQADILIQQPGLSGIDLLVSNPPYIPPAEKELMSNNVLNYEPHLALFVPENNPLIFYTALARQGHGILTPGGTVVAEINERFGPQTAGVFQASGYSDVVVKKDINGKDRVLLAKR